ncbi:MAG TPA: hypothetical protein VFT22_35425 [Kofleriaceae bacterium]|nr:hypothetical protein [Kofleriaceae bacterium]
MGGSDDRNQKLGIVCTGSFTITGTFAPADTPPRPIDPETSMPILGCWPVGTWTFSAQLAESDCAAPPSVLPSYSFKLDKIEGTDGQGFVDQITNMTDIGSMQVHLAVSSNGQGCEGNFELGSADGKDYWHMQPSLLNPINPADPPTTTITGNGDYDEYSADGWPWKPAP